MINILEVQFSEKYKWYKWYMLDTLPHRKL